MSADGPSKLQLEARACAADYNGRTAFMKKMRSLCRTVPGWMPTPKQAFTILQIQKGEDTRARQKLLKSKVEEKTKISW